MSDIEGNQGSARGAELVIEDSESAQRAAEVATAVPLERPPSVPGAVIGGLVGALLGAIVWWGLIRATGYELGLVAIGVGVLAGFGVVKGGGRGSQMQIIGAACALAGILLGRVLFYYFGFEQAFVDEMVKQGGSAEMARETYQLAKQQGVITLGMFFKESMSAMDLIMFGIGMFEGWRIPRSQS